MSRIEARVHSPQSELFLAQVPWIRRDVPTKNLCEYAEARLLASLRMETAVLLRFPPSQIDINDQVYPFTMVMKFFGVPTALTLIDFETPTGSVPKHTWILPDKATTAEIAEAYDEGIVRHSLVGSAGTFTQLRPLTTQKGASVRTLEEQIACYKETAADTNPKALIFDSYFSTKSMVTRAAFRLRHKESLMLGRG